MKQVTSLLAGVAVFAIGISCSQNPESNDSRSGLSSDFLGADGKRYETVFSLDDIEDECTGPADLGKIYYVQNINALMACKYVEDDDGEVSYVWAEIDLSGKDGKDGKDGVDGKDGKDGKNSIIAQYHLEPGDSNCPDGGTNFVSCLDVDGDLKCTQDDVNIQMTYICASDADVDLDNDGVKDWEDNCVAVANPDQKDADGDKVGDVCDNAPNRFNPDQLDTDSDGVADVVDNCRTYPNPDQADANGNNRGDLCDPFMIPGNIIKLFNSGKCTGCNLHGVNFSNVDFAHIADHVDHAIDLSGSNLRKAKFTAAELDGAKFVKSGVEGADFSDASLVGANFTDAMISDETDFDGADTTDAVGLP